MVTKDTQELHRAIKSQTKIFYSPTNTTNLKYKYRSISLGGHMLNMKKISESYEMKVFTDQGDYFGDIEEAILTSNKIFGWRVRATKSSFLNRVLGSAKGVIVPHQLVKSIGDIMIINKSAVPNYSTDDE